MRETVLAVGVALMALGSLVPQLRAGPAGGALPIATAYEAVVDAIPSSSVVLILTVSPDPNAIAERYLAQHVLAPRLVREAGDNAEFAVTAPGAPPAIDGDSRLQSFELVRVTEAGVRLYRRRY